MDVSDILAAHDAKQYVRRLSTYGSTNSCCNRKSVLVEKEIPFEVDAGFLVVTDLNPIDAESYECVNHTFPFAEPVLTVVLQGEP